MAGRNYFSDPFDGLRQGAETAQGFQDTYTRARAGSQYARGDRSGAAQTFAMGGNIDAARQLEADQQREQDRARAQEQKTYERGRQESQDQLAQTQRRVEVLTKVAKGLATVPVGQRQAALQRAMPIFSQLGLDASHFASLTEDQLTDDNLALFAGELEKQWQAVNLGNGGFGKFNNRTGDFSVERQPDKIVVLPNGAIGMTPEGKTIGRNPKTFAPRSAGGGGGGGGASLPPGYVPR